MIESIGVDKNKNSQINFNQFLQIIAKRIQIKNEDGVFETDPEHKVVVFALELNEGDYKTMAFPLSEAEEDGMRADYAAKKAAEVERNTVGPRHFS